MRFKKWPRLPGAGRTRAGHHHGSHTPTSPEAVLLGKMAYHTKQIRRQCILQAIPLIYGILSYGKMCFMFMGYGWTFSWQLTNYTKNVFFYLEKKRFKPEYSNPFQIALIQSNRAQSFLSVNDDLTDGFLYFRSMIKFVKLCVWNMNRNCKIILAQMYVLLSGL